MTVRATACGTRAPLGVGFALVRPLPIKKQTHNANDNGSEEQRHE